MDRLNFSEGQGRSHAFLCSIYLMAWLANGILHQVFRSQVKLTNPLGFTGEWTSHVAKRIKKKKKPGRILSPKLTPPINDLTCLQHDPLLGCKALALTQGVLFLHLPFWWPETQLWCPHPRLWPPSTHSTPAPSQDWETPVRTSPDAWTGSYSLNRLG